MRKPRMKLPPQYDLLDNLPLPFSTRCVAILSDSSFEKDKEKLLIMYLSAILLTAKTGNTAFSDGEVADFANTYYDYLQAAASHMKEALVN